MSKKKFANRPVPVVKPVASPAARTKEVTSPTDPRTYWFVALLLVLPIIFSREAQDPAITPRYILLSVFVAVFTLFFFIFRKSESGLPWPPIVKYIFITGLALVAWSIATLIVAVNPTAGYYDILRQLLNLSVLFIITAMVAGNEKTVMPICKVLVIMAIIQGFVGTLQFYDVAFKELPGANAKPFGLMANRNLFGSAQAFLVPFVVYVLYLGSRNWKIISGVALISLISSLIISQTRAAWVATLGMLIISLILVLIFSAVNRKKWLIGTFAALVVAFVIGALLMIADKDGLLSQQVKERTASLVKAAPDSVHSMANVNDRFRIWKKTSNSVKDHPLIGVGTGNWKLTILSYGGNGTSWSGGFYVPDRVHNVFIQMAAETGIPGALIYITFWLLVVVAGLKVVIRPVSESQRILVILMLAGLAAFTIDSMFSFPTERIEHMLYVSLMAGIILGNFIRSNKIQSPGMKIPKWIPIAIISIAVMNLVMGMKKHSFEKNLNYATAYENENRFQELLDYAAAGTNSWVNVDQVGVSLAAKKGVAYRGLKNYPKALEEFRLAMKYNPNSTMVYNNMGTVYTEMNDFKAAIPYYERALFLAPDFDIVRKNLAYNYYSIGNYKAAVKTLEKVNITGDEFLINILRDAQVKAAAQP